MNGSRSTFTLWGAIGVLVATLSVLAYVLILMLRPAHEISLERSREQMRHQWFHKAIATLTTLLEENSDNVDALLARGVCYIKTGQYSKAREDFEHALRRRPGDPAAELGLAEVLWGEGDYDAALNAAQTLANAHPDMPQCLTLAGKTYYKLFEREARECVRILEDRPRSAATLAAASEVRQGRFESAELCWTEWHSIDPGAAMKSGLRERLDAAKRNFDLALENLRAASGQGAARPDPGDPEAWLLLAALLLEKGDDVAAEATADRALAFDGIDRTQAALVKAEALSSRAARLMQEGANSDDAAKTAQADALNTQAIQLLENLVRQAPATAAAKDKLAVLYIRAGRFDEAAELAQQSVKESRSVKARYVKAIVHLAREEFDEAATEFLSVRDELANEPRLHFGLGLAYYRRGGETAAAALAIQQFRRVVDLRPNFVPARMRLARLYIQQGWYEEARKECEKILAIPGRPLRLNAQVYLLLSEAYRGLKQYDQVLQILHKAAEEAPSESALLTQEAVRIELGMEREVIGRYAQDKTNPTYLCIVGQALLKKGERDEAIKQFRRAIEVNPQFIMAYVYLASAHESAGEYAEAARQYERAIRMLEDLRLPRNRSIHFGLGLVRIKQGRFADAEAQFKTVLDIARQERTDHPAARLRLAALELRKPEPNFDRALSEVRSVIRHSETAEARFLAGLIHSAAARRPAELIRAEIRAMRSGDPARRDAEVTDADVEARRHLSWDEAVKEYERAIELDPRFRFSYEVALIYALQRRFDRMAAVCQKALDVSPASARPQLLRWLAVARLGGRDIPRAIEAAREAIRLSLESSASDPADVLHARFILVNCRIANADLEGARAELDLVGADTIGFREALDAMLARLDLAKREAVVSGSPAAARLCETVGLELNLAMLFSRAGLVWLPEAERTYRALLRKDPENVVALRYLSDLYIVMGEYAKAEDVNRLLLKALPSFALALRNLAAIEDLRTRAIAATRATTQERLDAQQEAIRLYESAAQASPNFWLPRLELGALYQRAGANDKAMALYEQVIALNPQQVQALNDYANLCAEEKKNLDKAIEYARKAKELSPFDGAVADTLGVLHTLLGQPEAAVEQLEQARYLLPTHPTVRYHLAVAYDQTGKKEKALALLDELLGGDAKFPERAEAEALRDRLRKP